MAALTNGPQAILRDLAALPTASYHEEQVAAFIQGFLSEHGLDFRYDPYGNIVACHARGPSAQPLALVAHMDHPAFEIVAEDGGQWRGLLLGGVFSEYFASGAPVRIYTRSGAAAGRVAGLADAPDRSQTLLRIDAEPGPALGDWGTWDIPDFRAEGDLLHLPAADDLAGCSVILATLLALQERGIAGEVYGVFTRAEEVGLLGSIMVAKQRLLPERTLVISVEASRHLPGAAIGDGPVIRVGDARRTFDAVAEAYLWAARDALRQDDPAFKVQRQLLSGGTCEATAFGLFGYGATGVALPLGNYHNMGPDNRLAPELIHQQDLGDAVTLLAKAAELAAAPLADPLRARYEALAEANGPRLRETAESWARRLA